MNENPFLLPLSPERLSFVTYEGRFEKDAAWLMGPRILAKICRHMMGKSLIVVPDDEIPDRIIISLPDFPTVWNELDGKMVNIYYMIPEDLRIIVETCCHEVMLYRLRDMEIIDDSLLPCENNPNSLYAANMILQLLENNRVALNDPYDPPLWECLAERFGFSPLAVRTLPEPFKNVDKIEDNLS